MKISLKETEHEDRYFLNGKSVWKDIDGDWRSQPVLSKKEAAFFLRFLRELK